MNEPPKNDWGYNLVRKLIIIVGIMLAGVALYATFTGVLSIMRQRVLHIGLAVVLAILVLYEKSYQGGKKINWLNNILLLAMIGASAVASVYLTILDTEIVFHLGAPNSLEIILGVLMIFSLLEITRRTMGPILPTIALIAILYAVLGPYMPAGLGHRGYNIERLVSYLFLSDDGVYGVPTGVSATVVVMFIIFGSFLQKSGAGTVFKDGSFAIFGRVRGGPAKVAVVTSALFGTINGSAIANVATTGTFTIPLMKNIGYKPAFAGAVEAVASTGGQIMPPIMGAAAFIMAQVLGVSYPSIALAAIIPSLLFFYMVFLVVDLQALKRGMKGLPSSELPRLKVVAANGWHVIVTMSLLLYFLLGLRLSPNKSALYSCALCIFFSWFSKNDKMKVKEILDALVDAGRGVISVALACSTAGIVIGVLGLTGLGLKLSSLLVTWSGGSLIVLMILTMITGIILGMGLPTTGVYIILSVLAAPALVEMGVTPLAAHFFVFYYGVLAAITPPVALAAYAGAGIAGADYMETGWHAVKLGLAGFIVPFIFIFAPAILGQGTIMEIVHVTATAFLGITALSVGIQGAPVSQKISRFLLVISSLFLLKPGITTDLIGVLLIITAYISDRIMKKGVMVISGENK
ncbi:MAG: TRAP transporter permease [Peptococcaceae bacterium]